MNVPATHRLTELETKLLHAVQKLTLAEHLRLSQFVQRWMRPEDLEYRNGIGWRKKKA